jgi:mono/diheme cytochrome c family protein
MQRFLTWTAALMVMFAVGVTAQANLTPEDHAKIMKANAQAAGATNKAIGSGAFADAKTQVATLRANYTSLLAFYSAKKKDDAVALLKGGLTQLDTVDTALSAATPDAMAAQTAMKKFQGSCGGCHKQYREGDAQTGYKFKADF